MDSKSPLIVEGLSEAELKALFEAAKAVLPNAYAPYSNYSVASSLLCAPNHIHTGVNVENASYPVCVCAERVAIGSAITAGHTELRAILVFTMNDKPIPPCGACRQVLFEFRHDLPVILANQQGPSQVIDLNKLLPGGFTSEDIEDTQ
jgi:cytidine deaminase